MAKGKANQHPSQPKKKKKKTRGSYTAMVNSNIAHKDVFDRGRYLKALGVAGVSQYVSPQLQHTV